ncbi:MAG: hypothetical protein JWR27_2517 [Aeromicrobium sp.]|jgi:hypothetical protein|nr:hypothetical protein [Aeromicrobium sp.]
MKVKGYLGSAELDGSFVTVKTKVAGSTTIPLAAIQSVSIISAGIGMKGIRFAVAGGSVAGLQSFIGSHSKLAEDPYALTFRSSRREEFEAFMRAVLTAKYQ